jgi:hypothetical protein
MALGPFARLLIIPLLFAGACEHAHTLRPPAHITHIDVMRRSIQLVKRIESQHDISAIVAFVSEHSSGWTEPLAGVPVAQIYAYFYDGDQVRGHFGVGPGFFESDLAGDFRSIGATRSETDRFLALLGMQGTKFE